jgi:NAD(P)H-hydrate repair Nnr-like enzyme with NAD(P)H-hydrate dehydratase domain
VLWHALAGEVAAAGVDRGVLASEVSAALPKVLAS